MKLAVVTPIPTPYRDPFWNVVARQPGVELSVFYCAAGKKDRPWNADWDRGYAGEILRGHNLLRWRSDDASCFVNPAVVANLRAARPDALIVGGYNHPTMWSAIRYALRRDIPYFLMCETFAQQSRGWRGRIKRRMVEWAIGHAAGLLPTGRRAAAFLMDRGGASDRITLLPNVPDVLELGRRAESLRPQREELRRGHGIASRPTALFVGRLIPKKRTALLLRAFARALPTGEANLLVVGDGPERASLESDAQQLGIADAVRFAGFVQPDRVPLWHAMADVFVLPSAETWGVSPIEALASGLPVILSEGVGCHPDVVNSSSVGRVVPTDDEEQLAACLRAALSWPPSAAAVTEAWRPVRETFRYDRLAARLLAAVGRAVSSRSAVPAAASYA